LLGLAQVYGRTEVLAAIARALELKTYDALIVPPGSLRVYPSVQALVSNGGAS
jgi:hypothetical protein